MGSRMGRASLTLLFLLTLAVVALPPAPAAADERLVDCTLTPPRRIANALRLPGGRALTIVVKGTCRENVVITRDDLTLKSHATTPGTIEGTSTNDNTILIDGAKRVVIEGVTITGRRNGITAVNGASFTVKGAAVQGNRQNGIVVLTNSTADVRAIKDTAGNVIRATTAQNNGKAADSAASLGRSGIVVADNGSAFIVDTVIADNAGSGVSVSRGGSARIGLDLRGTPGSNTIEGNGSGVSVASGGYAQVQGNTIRLNQGSGVSVDAASATIASNLIHENTSRGVSVSNSAGARIGLTEGDAAAGNEIHHNGSDGIGIFNGANASVYGNLLESNGGRGVNVGRASGRSIGNNTIRANASDGVFVGAGQYFQGKGDFGVSPNRDVITGNGTGPNGGFGIQLFDGAAADVLDVEVTGNASDGIGVFHGATLTLRPDAAARALISGNGTRFLGSGINGSNGASLDVRNTDITLNSAHGITMNTRVSLQLRGSVVSGNASHGIQAVFGSAVNVFGSSTIEGNGTAGTGLGSGIHAFLGVAVSVSDSIVRNNTVDGINAQGNSSLSIGNNGSTPLTSISGNTQAGIRVTNASFGNVFGAAANPVTIADNGNVGIFCQESLFNGTTFTLSGNNGGGSQTFPDPFTRACTTAP